MRRTQFFCEIATSDLSYVVRFKSIVEISQNFVTFSEYMNFNLEIRSRLAGNQNPVSIVSLFHMIPQREFKFECAIYNSKLQWSFVYLLQGGRWGAKSQARVSWPIGKLTTPTHNSGIPKPDGGARSCHNMIRTTMCCHQITILF